MIKELQAAEVDCSDSFNSDKIGLGRNLIIAGEIEDCYISIENEPLDYHDAVLIRDYFVDLVMAMRSTSKGSKAVSKK